jgi:FemAB-related protein (PEP-CTERM system-associated)
MVTIQLHRSQDLAEQLPRLESYVARRMPMPLSRHPAWLSVLERGLGHSPYCLEAREGDVTRGVLTLAGLRSLLFGRFLVGLPYLNSGGVVADDEGVSRQLIGRAVGLADELRVRHLELRHEQPVEHPALGERLTTKVHMRLALPATVDELWKGLPSKVRNQVRAGQKHDLTVAWGGFDLLPEFHAVFSRNMRDLGTPAYGRPLFRSVLRQFPDRAEFCVVRSGGRAVAAALLLHGWGVTEVPSASSLRPYNSTNCNMLMYWNLLERAVLRGQGTFDFGRSTLDSNTYRFKKQWGAAPEPAEWQYHVRKGSATAMRPDNPANQQLIRIWQRLPLAMTRFCGPAIVRGIP